MRSKIVFAFMLMILSAVAIAFAQQAERIKPAPARNSNDDAVFDGTRLERSDAQWKRMLTPEAFHVLRERGTERAFTGKLTDNKRAGTYACAACGLHLFSSKHKYDSGTGWPSFYQVIHKTNVLEEVDNSLADETRTEVICARCGSHLGHVFDDGPEPTGLRYCINSVALKFLPR